MKVRLKERKSESKRKKSINKEIERERKRVRKKITTVGIGGVEFLFFSWKVIEKNACYTAEANLLAYNHYALFSCCNNSIYIYDI